MIITEGYGEGQLLVTEGYGSGSFIIFITEIIDILSNITILLNLRSDID